MNKKRDIYENAVPREQYFRSSANAVKESRKLLHSSDAGILYWVPLSERQKVPEKTIQSAILKHLRSRGVWCFKTKTANIVGSGDDTMLATTDKGLPDIIACIGGRLFGIEVKAPQDKKRVSADQLRQLRRIREAGGHGIVVHSLAMLQDYFAFIAEDDSHRLEWPILVRKQGRGKSASGVFVW